MSWVGGKKSQRDLIVSLFPLNYANYVEVFGGAGWILFHKRRSRAEVFNDKNSLLTNLYRCVRDNAGELKDRLRYVLNSREDFDLIKRTLTVTHPADPVQRAAMFYQLIRHSYASGLKSFACQPHSLWADFPAIDAACQRLDGVVIENQDFQKLITHYDRPDTLFYLDPPYFETEGYYFNVGEGGFGLDGHTWLRDTLLGIEGFFLLSYNDHPFIRELYDAPGVFVMENSRLNNIKQRYDGGCMFNELLIANYDIRARRETPVQMTIFEDLLPAEPLNFNEYWRNTQ